MLAEWCELDDLRTPCDFAAVAAGSAVDADELTAEGLRASGVLAVVWSRETGVAGDLCVGVVDEPL
jgi:hypothetical protein